MSNPSDIALAEQCSCGASFKLEGMSILVNAAVETWRATHRHETPERKKAWDDMSDAERFAAAGEMEYHPAGNLGGPDPCGLGVCGLGDGHEGRCRS